MAVIATTRHRMGLRARKEQSSSEVFMRRRILLVDDDATVLLTLKAVLELHQFEVQTATSAADAVEKLASGVYEMVITDARMETDDAGFHVIRAARQQAYKPATALLTAYPPRNADWERNGVQSLLVKPVGTQDLLRQIEALLVQQQDEKQSLDRARTNADATSATSRQKAS
jgi:DNA-binding NtrC family response regulator